MSEVADLPEYELTKKTLISMCTAIERAVGDGPVSALALFQRRRYFERRRRRWTRLAEQAGGGPVILGFVDADPEQVPAGASPLPIDLDGPLAGRWTLLVASPSICGIVDASDRDEVEAGPGTLEARRIFRSTWSVEPAAVEQQAARLIEEFPSLEVARPILDDIRRHARSATPIGSSMEPLLRQLTDVDLEATAARVERVQWQMRAERDDLTGAHNRAGLERMLLGPLRDQPVAAMFFDLDDFKEVNDVHGHLAGDQLLQATAKTLQEQLRLTDLVVRWGGDEFLVVVTDTAADALADEARRLLDAINRIRLREFPTVRVRASAGIEANWRQPVSITALDEAMYRAKAEGGNTMRSTDD